MERARTGLSPRWGVIAVGLFVLILAPLPLLEPFIADGITALSGASVSPAQAAAGVVALLAVDVFVPVPSSIVATVAGHRLGVVGGAASIWLGLNLGCLVGYLFGRRVGAVGLARYLGDEEVDRARAWLSRYSGGAGIAISRAVPMVSEAAVLLAGAVKAPPARIAAICALANAGVALAYAAVGALAAQLNLFPLAVAGSLLLPAVAAVVTGALRR